MMNNLDSDQSKALREAAEAVSEAWNAWMMDEEGEGQDAMEQAIARLRAALDEENR